MSLGYERSWNTAADATPPDDDRIVAALEEYASALRAGLRVNRQEYLSRFPEIADALSECLEGLEFVQGAGMEINQYEPAVEFGSDGTLGDYRILREAGRGGMGVVYEAEQISLHRRVALKVLPFAATIDSRQLQRFCNESRAAASLRHEHIVHVYGVGYERGVHYYAMEFIDGQPLTAVIESLKNHDTRSSSSSNETNRKLLTAPLASLRPGGPDLFRNVATLVAQAADALDYAHGLGIIHRDVKPSNLLLDKRGKLWVTDFGLAKLGADTGGTVSGELLGTLRYMSPEQALAHHGLVDHRTDVYALGATLYELLTLYPAVPGTDKQEVLQRIAFEEPARPSLLEPNIPLDLETIVLKALEKQTETRYASAKALGDDLKRWLEDKPILAKRPGLRHRIGKWMRRHAGVTATIAASAAMLSLAMIAGLMINNRMIRREQLQTRTALVAETQARQQAMAALRSLTDDLMERQLARQETLTHDDRAFLKSILSKYEAFAAVRGDGPESRAIRAEGSFRVGVLRGRLGEVSDALADHERAREMYRELTHEFPNTMDYRATLNVLALNLGNLLNQQGQTTRAEAEFRAAITDLRQLVTEIPNEPTYRRDLASCRIHLGLLLKETGRRPDAETEYREALVLRQQLAKDYPAELRYRTDLIHIHNKLGILLMEAGKLAESEKEYSTAIAIGQQLVTDAPTASSHRRVLAASHRNLGLSMIKLGRTKEAEAEFRRSFEMRRQLAVEYPALPAYRQELASGHVGIAGILKDARQPEKAEAEYRQALVILQQLVAEYPNIPGFRSDLADAYNHLGELMKLARKWVEAEAAYRREIELRDQLVIEMPSLRTQRQRLANALSKHATLLKQMGRPGDAIAECRRANVLHEKLAAEFPDEPADRKSLALCHFELGVLLATTGQWDEADQEHRQAVFMREQLAAEFSDNIAYAVDLGGSYCNYGLFLIDRQLPDQALKLFDQALGKLKPLLTKNPPVDKVRLFTRNSYWGQALALVKLNRFSDALPDWDHVIELDQGPQRKTFRMQRALCQARIEPANAVAAANEVIGGDQPATALLYDAARVVSVAAGQEKDDAVRKEWTARAISLLNAARERGYFRPKSMIDHLRRNTEFDALRETEEFQRLLLELEETIKGP